jgi:hypothetical protein
MLTAHYSGIEYASSDIGSYSTMTRMKAATTRTRKGTHSTRTRRTLVMLLVATQVAFHWAPKNYE